MSAWLGPALALLALAAGVVAFVRLPPRQGLAAAVLAAAAGLAALRQFALAVPAAAVGVSLWRRSGRGAAGARPSPGQQSGVRTAGLAMTLDHDSGQMDGEVLTGPLRGRMLSELSAEDLQRLVDQFDATDDQDSLSLLLAFLDRRRGEGPGETPPPPPPAMTETEAYLILGLAPGASVDEVRAAYHRLIRRVHPDLGGSSPLAAMLNAAKELLDPG